MPLYHFRHTLPVFDAHLNIVFCDDVNYAREQMTEFLGERDLGKKQNYALCEWDNKGNFVVIFDINYLTHGLISHEISHLTTGIMEMEDLKEDGVRALISDYCADTIYKYIKSKKVKVK